MQKSDGTLSNKDPTMRSELKKLSEDNDSKQTLWKMNAFEQLKNFILKSRVFGARFLVGTYTPLFLNSVLIEPPSIIMRIASASNGATESTRTRAGRSSGSKIESVTTTSQIFG